MLVIVLGLVGLVIFGALDAYAFGGPEGLYTNRYRSSWGEHGAHVVMPPGNHLPGSLPAVVMIHEWWGMDQETVKKAEILAGHGFLVVVPDALLGRSAATVPGALLLALSTPLRSIHQAVDGAFDYAANHPLTDPQRVGIIGFCFGGRQAMQFGMRDPRPAALVTAYGSSLATENIGRLGENGPVLGIFGEDDRSIPLEEVGAFQTILEQSGVDTTITVYGGVGHAFIKTEGINRPGTVQQAWNQIVEFLSLHLIRRSSGGMVNHG